MCGDHPGLTSRRASDRRAWSNLARGHSATTINFVIHEPIVRWPAILVFMMSGSLYIGWQLMLVIVSLSKICLKADGGWEVTDRLVTAPAEKVHVGGGDGRGANGGGGGGGGNEGNGGDVANAPSTPPMIAGAPLGSPLAAAFSPAGSKSPPQDATARDAKLSWSWLPASILAPLAAHSQSYVQARGPPTSVPVQLQGTPRTRELL